MKKEDIQPWDWQRILFGQAPPEYLIEVFVRTTLIYLALLVIVRALGKRMGGQLSISELAVMVTLGAIVSPAMQIPQLGLLLGIMILTCALIFQRGLSFAEFKSKKIEKISQGGTELLVKNGIILTDHLDKAKITRQQLFAAIRDEHVFNLGDIGRVYLEPFGCFSVFKRDEPVAGLQIFPPTDAGINCYEQEMVHDHHACVSCGKVEKGTGNLHACNNCGSHEWMQATISVQHKYVNQ